MIKKTIFTVAIIGALAVPLFSWAATVNTTVAVSVSAAPTMTPVGCYPFSRSLFVGANGPDVIALQNYLKVQGYFNTTPTGYFGPITKAAVGQWQVQNNVAALGSAGNGIFGPLSRGAFVRVCAGSGGGNGGGQGSGSESFSVSPQSGGAPLAVQFVASAPQGTTLGNSVNFGDGTTGNLGFVPVCSSCNAEGIVTHTYLASGTYTAELTSGNCSCPADGVCNCPNILILATTTVIVGQANTTVIPTSTTASNIQQLNAPGTVTLSTGGIAEIRNESAYFTVQNITSSSAMVQVTPVGCWNSFPSDPQPRIICMIAMVPIPPQIFAVGETYNSGKYSITLTQLNNGMATFDAQ